MSERELEEREIERLQRTALKKKTTNQPTSVPKWKQQQNNPPPPIKKVEPVKKTTPPVNSSSYVETEQKTKNENIIVESSPFIKSNPQEIKNDIMDREMQRLMGYTNVPVNNTSQSNGEQDKDDRIIEERSPFIKNEEKEDDEDREMQRLMGYTTVKQSQSNTQQDKPNNENVIVEEISPFIKSNIKGEDEKKNEMMEREMQRLMGYTNVPVNNTSQSNGEQDKDDRIIEERSPFIKNEEKEDDEDREMQRLMGYTTVKQSQSNTQQDKPNNENVIVEETPTSPLNLQIIPKRRSKRQKKTRTSLYLSSLTSRANHRRTCSKSKKTRSRKKRGR
eukprot:TRINITY_DN81_c0_g1_i2.p1 TRINITY_DN81_c0_g1~~TRINITY_DN81_c0_g1_i2.p1  ORF type:complete len:334 (+),score=123.03 TRINITY_DN81_c0_g1_i2:182-1183(+)